MNNLVIPPSPSWYLSNIIACNDDGVIAYGARHEIIIVKQKPEAEFSPYNLEYSYIPAAHKDRITCIAFSPNNAPETFRNCLVSASDDGSVRLWDIETLELKLINSGPKEPQKIAAVDWSSSDPNVVISVSDQRVLYCWDLPSNRLRKLNLGPKVVPVSLSICPHDKQIVAVGAKAGLILIVSLKGEGGVKFRMRSHDSDVISLSWCPVKYNVFRTTKEKLESGNNDYELLLASGGKDRTIYFWRVGTDGRYETFINLPAQPYATGYRSKMVGDKGNVNIWGCVQWIDPFTLLSGSQFGELLSWDLHPTNKPGQAIKSGKLLHGRHSKGVFSISCQVTSSKNSEDNRVVWTTAVDRKLIAYSLKTGKILTELTTIGGIVYCMAISPLDPNRIAVGVGDGKILIWNMSCSDQLDIKVFWQKINSKVMAMEWHPTEENWLAFGTGEGRVGIIDVGSNKPPIIFRQHHHRSVYRVLWSPHIKEKNLNHTGKYELALFSVGDGEILQHSVNTPEKEPVKLNDILAKADVLSGLDKSGRTEFLTNHDRSLIAVGNENGVVYILDTKTYEKQSTLLAHKKIVQCLTWHPASVTSDPSRLSPCLNWLAVASDSVKVFSIGLDGKTFETVAALTVHTEKVVDLAWSPHLNGHLVSSSYDYTAQVWDVTTQSPIANFNKHHNAVLCSLWSPIKPEYVITGSSDNTVRVWKVSEQPNKRCTESKKLRLNNVTKRIENAPEAVDNAPDRNTLRVEANAMANQVKKSSTKVIEPRTAELDPVKEWNAGQEKRTKGKSLFPVTSAALSVSKHFEAYYQQWKSKQTTESVATENAIVNGDSSTDAPTDSGVQNKENLNELAYLDFFGDGNAMRKLMKTEETHLLKENRMSVAQQCTLWRGDITEIIREAMNKKQLNDWLMTLAPMASLRLWQEACVIYSEQLANQGDFMKAACYLLGVHKVEEAVQLLSDHKYHREAVALAKCRLPDDDPVVQNAMRQYAETAQSDGMLNLAAHCFLSLGDPLAASQALARGKDLKSLKLAALLANEANAVEVADALAKEALCSGLMAGDFESCSEILEHHHNLKILNIWINTNKMLNENKRLDFSSSLNWLQGRANDTNSVLNKIKEEVKKGGDCYDQLKANVNCFITLDTEKQLWLFISSHLSLSGAANTYSITLHHVVQALAAAYRFQINSDKNDILIRVCMLLSPKGPLTEDSIFVRESESDEEKLLISSMHSFLLAGIVSWLNESLRDDEDENRDILKQFLSTSNDNQDDKFAWLTSVIEACQADLFDYRNIEYFKNETLIKNLELKIASSRCNLTNEKGEHRVMLTAVRNKNKRAKKQIKLPIENYSKTDDSLNSNEKSNSDEKVKEDNVSNNQSDKKDAAVTCDAVKTVMTIDKTAVIISEDKPSEELVNVNTGDIIPNDSSNSQEVIGSEDNVNNVNSLNVLQSSMVNVDSVSEVSSSENRQLSSNQSENENKIIEVVKDDLSDSINVSEVKGAVEISTLEDNKISNLNKMENGNKSLDVEKVDSTKISGVNNNESSDSNQVENKSIQLEDKVVEDEKLPIDSNLSLGICNNTESNNSNQLEKGNKSVETIENTLEDSENKKIHSSIHIENVKNLVPETEGSKTDSNNIKDKNCNSSNKNIFPKGIELESSNVSIQIVNKIDKKLPSNSSIVIEFNNNCSDDSKYLQRLNASKLKFESEKVSTPNPFFTYCQLQKVMVSLLKDENPVLYELLKNKIEESWKSANAN